VISLPRRSGPQRESALPSAGAISASSSGSRAEIHSPASSVRVPAAKTAVKGNCSVIDARCRLKHSLSTKIHSYDGSRHFRRWSARKPNPSNRMADNRFPADLSHDTPAKRRQPPDDDFRERSASNESFELPRLRLGGISVVLTIASFLLTSSAGFFGFRAILASKSISPAVSAVKANREPNKIELASRTSQDQFGDKQAAVARRSVEDGKTLEHPSMPVSHVVATIPIKTNQDELSEVGMAGASSTLVASHLAPPRGAEVSEAPASSAAAPSVGRNLPQIADTAAGSVGNSNPAREAPPALRNGFAVQVASERSQSGAQASFRRLQTKYPNQLRGHQPVIRRADLGAGTYFRALVGPFASRGVAIKLCNALKAVGGDCIIQKI
jgi:SPOR domain